MNSCDKTIEIMFSVSRGFYDRHSELCDMKAEDRGYKHIENFIEPKGIRHVTHTAMIGKDATVDILVTVTVDNNYINKLKLKNSGDYRIFKVLYIADTPLRMGQL